MPEIHWVINSGNTRRESTQALLIPEMKKAGFNVIADNCDAACYFQQRLPALEYDMAMYINTASPDPTVTGIMACDLGPVEANGNQGQNSAGWCNEDASKLMTESDQTRRRDASVPTSSTRSASSSPTTRSCSRCTSSRTSPHGVPTRSVARSTQDAANYQAFQNINALGGHQRRRPDRHRCRAVARVPQPDHRMRQLVVVPVDDGLQGAPQRVGHHFGRNLRGLARSSRASPK